MDEASERSRKPSAGKKDDQSPPEQFVLYLDENLCNCVPVLEALQQNGIKHERHLTHFASGTPDHVWLPFVGQNQWVLLTRDQAIRYRNIEHSRVVRYNIREFVFKAGNLHKQELARVLIIAIPKMREVCRKYKPPFIASITKLGVVNMRFDENGPLHGRFPPARRSSKSDVR
ncbi:MAG: hypothetical protein ACLP3K_01025 [Candidatus Acidiferrales bacterium]